MNTTASNAEPSARTRGLGAGFALVMACSQVGCARDPTALIVVIDADQSVMNRLMPPNGTLVVAVYSASGALIREEIFPQQRRMLPMPLTFAITQTSGTAKVRVEVAGYPVDPMQFGMMRSEAGPPTLAPIIRARAIAPFVRDAVKVVPIPLRGACLDQMMPCPLDQTCVVSATRPGMPMQMPVCGRAELNAADLSDHSPEVDTRCADGGLRVGLGCENPGMMPGMPPFDGMAGMPPDARPPDNGPPPPADVLPEVSIPIDASAPTDLGNDVTSGQ